MKVFCTPLVQKTCITKSHAKLKELLDYLKSYYDENCNHCFHIAFTRQQIINLTGLRVEPVIKNLKKNGERRQHYFTRPKNFVLICINMTQVIKK